MLQISNAYSEIVRRQRKLTPDIGAVPEVGLADVMREKLAGVCIFRLPSGIICAIIIPAILQYKTALRGHIHRVFAYLGPAAQRKGMVKSQ